MDIGGIVLALFIIGKVIFWGLVGIGIFFAD